MIQTGKKTYTHNVATIQYMYILMCTENTKMNKDESYFLHFEITLFNLFVSTHTDYTKTKGDW